MFTLLLALFNFNSSDGEPLWFVIYLGLTLVGIIYVTVTLKSWFKMDKKTRPAMKFPFLAILLIFIFGISLALYEFLTDGLANHWRT